MPTIPRILRALPGPERTPLPQPRRVIAILHWSSLGICRPARAWALATSPHPAGTVVLTLWIDPLTGTRHDWLPARDLLHPGQHIHATRRVGWEDPPPLDSQILPAPDEPAPLQPGDDVLR